MTTLSRELMQEAASMRSKLLASGDYEGSRIANLAEDHFDGVSKRHLPDAEYLDVLTEIFGQIKTMDFTTEHEAEVLTKILELVDLYRQVYVG